MKDSVEKRDLPPNLLLELASRLICEGVCEGGILSNRLIVHWKMRFVQDLCVKRVSGGVQERIAYQNTAQRG